MARDIRDPKLLGEALISLSQWAKVPLRNISADRMWELRTPDYSANPGPLEKYGDPRKLPSTLPN